MRSLWTRLVSAAIRLSALPAFLSASPAGAQTSGLYHDTAAPFSAFEYHVALNGAFSLDPLGDQGCRAFVQMIHVPSFMPERSVGVCRTASGYEVFSAVPEQSLYGALHAEVNGQPVWSLEAARRVAVEWHRTPIDSATAALVGAVWERAIRSAQYPGAEAEEVSTDGASAYFIHGPWMTAHAPNPEEGSVAGALMALGFLVGDYAQTDAVAVETVRATCARVTALLDELE